MIMMVMMMMIMIMAVMMMIMMLIMRRANMMIGRRMWSDWPRMLPVQRSP